MLVHRIASATLRSVVLLGIALTLSSCVLDLGKTIEPTITSTTAPTEVPLEHAFLAFETTQLAYTDGSREVYSSTVYLLDHGDQTLTKVPGHNNVRFVWSPLGSYLAAVSNTPGSPFASTYTMCSIETGACIEQACGGQVSGFYEWSPDERYFLTASSHTGDCWGFNVWEGDGSALLVDAECHGCCTQHVGYRPLEWRDGILLADFSKWGGGPEPLLDTSGLYLLNPLNAEWTLLEARDCGDHTWGCWASVGPNFGPPEPCIDNRAYSADGSLLAIAEKDMIIVEEIATGETFAVPLPEDAMVVRMAWSP